MDFEEVLKLTRCDIETCGLQALGKPVEGKGLALCVDVFEGQFARVFIKAGDNGLRR